MRGSIETQGKFYINQNWNYGWDVALFSDKYFFQDYKIRSESLSGRLHQGVDLDRLPDRSGRPQLLRSARLPHPRACRSSTSTSSSRSCCRCSTTTGRSPSTRTRATGIGGEVNIDFNFTALTRDGGGLPVDRRPAARQGLLALRRLPDLAAPNPALPNFKPPSCFIRGIAGDYERASAQVSWQRKFIDPIGEVWTPFAFARFERKA